MINNYIKKFLIGNENNIDRNNFIWNTIAGGVNAAEAVVLMMVITRTNGLDAAGILSIAFALGNLLMTVGKFGVRNYQVTDVNNDYSFNTYYTLRVISSIVMLLISCFYVLIKYLECDYSFEKCIIVLGICIIYVIESFEDVFLGNMQLHGRLDIASKIFIIRWIIIMMTFTLLAVVKKSLFFAVVISAAISLLVDIYLIVVSCSIADVGRIRICFNKIYSLIRQCVSLFLAAFMTYYVTNAPKYAIDKFLTEDIQAYFGYISMPVFIVELLNCFLYQPQMVNLADEWNDGLLSDFNKRTRRQYIVIFGLTIICALGAYILGIPILSIVYGVGLDQFKTELVVLMVSGGALAFVGYTSVLLTIMRKQNILLFNMTVITILAYLGFGRAVVYKGMIGAIYYYLFLMAVLAIMNYCCTILIKYKCKSTIK